MVKKSHRTAILEAKKINLLFEEMVMALQLDTFDKKEEIVDKYMTLMHNSFKESYYTNKNNDLISKSNLQFEQFQCKHSIDTNHSHISSSQINEIFNYSGIDASTIDTTTYKQVEKLYLHKKIDMLQEIIHIIDPRSDFNTNNTSLSPAPIKQTGITFKELYELFIKEKKISFPNTSPTTWRDYDAAYKDFLYVTEYAEDKDIATFTKDDFREFIDALHNHLPASRTKKPQYRELPYSKLKELELQDNEKMATNTKKKKISTIKQIFDIAIDSRYSYLEENFVIPFLIKELRGRRSTAQKRKPLSDENLQKLFNSKFYTDKKEYPLGTAPEKYWIPLIALYTGMRQNEICQLHIEDVKKEVTEENETIWYFDINENGNKHLKNENAIRLMPLHPKLIELGFIDYFNSIKDKQERLWKNLRYHPTEKRYNIDYNKTFMKFFRKYVTAETDQVFHSLRHNVGDQLIKNTVRARLPKDLVNKLMGHEPDKDMTSVVYSQGYGVEELYEGIKTLKF